MAKTDVKTVDEYIATHPARVQAILQRVRRTIRKAVPGAEEAIGYQIPAYKLHGGAVLYFAGWKQHYSLYPATEPVVTDRPPEALALTVEAETLAMMYWRAVQMGQPRLLSDPEIARVREKFATYGYGRAE